MGKKRTGSLVEELLKPRPGCNWLYATCHPVAQDPMLLAFGQRPGYRDLLTPVKQVLRILAYMPEVPLADITAHMVEQAVIKMTADKRGYNSNYIAACVSKFRTFLRYARAHGAPLQPLIVEALGEFRRDRTVYAPTVVISTEIIDAFTEFIYRRGVAEDIVLWECIRSGARIMEPLMVCTEDVVFDPNTQLVAFRLAVKTKERFARQPKRAVPYIMALLKDREPGEFLLRYGRTQAKDAQTHDGRRSIMQTRGLVARNRLYALQTECFGEVKFRPKNMRSSWISHTVSAKPEAVALVADHCGNSVKTILQHYFKPQGDPLAEFID